MENNFNLKKFLTENKLTSNSKILNEVSENFLDAVFNSLNDMMRAGEISGEEFDAAKNKLDSNPASLTPFEKRKDIQAAAESLLKGVNEVTDSGDEMVPNDIIWTDEDEDTASQGTFNQFDQSAEDLDGYEVEVLGYSPSTGKAYVGSTFGSYGETAFDDVDDIRQMNSKETGYYMDALKQYEPEHFKKMSQLNQETNEVADSGDEMVLLSVSNRRLNASAQDISRILQKKAPGTFYIVRGNGGEPNETREVSREEALDYVEYYRSMTPPNLDQEKEELLGTKLKVLGWESHLSFKPDSMDETNEDQERDHYFSANQEEEEIVMQIAKDAIALIDEQPGTDAVSALLATIEFLDD